MEEINLRDLIEILIRRKWIILGAAAILIVLVGIYIFVVQDTLYEARASISVVRMDDSERSAISGSVEDMLESISNLEALNQRNLTVMVRSTEVVEKALTDAGLSEQYSPEEVAGKIILGFEQDSNLATLRIRDQNPENAAKLANAVANAFVLTVREEIATTAEENMHFLESQLELEREALDEVMMKEQEFMNQPRGIRDVNWELNELSEQLAFYSVDLRDLEVRFRGLTAAVESLDEDLQQTSNSEAVALISDRRAEAKSMKARVEAEIEAKEGLKDLILEDMRELRVLLSELENQQVTLTEDLERRREIYELFSLKYEEIRIVGGFEMGEAMIGLASDAHVPLAPLGTNRNIILVIAGILGLMIGVVAAFGKEYWENTKPEPKAS